MSWNWRGAAVGPAAWQEHAPLADGPVAPIGVWTLGRIPGRERCRAPVARSGDANRREPQRPGSYGFLDQSVGELRDQMAGDGGESGSLRCLEFPLRDRA